VAGFHGSGLSLGLISAKMVSEMMLEGKTDYECALFSPRRHL
jgi:glycine/D-amino acid oxidase-like deaminating enzyme